MGLTRVSVHLADLRSEKMSRMEKRDGQSGNEIVPAVRKNSSAQTAAKESEQAEERAVDCEQKHASHTFVSMCRTERDC